MKAHWIPRAACPRRTSGRKHQRRSQAETGLFPIAAGPHRVEFDWQRASGPDANDGSFHLWIDGTPVATLTGLSNSVSSVDFARLGVLSSKAGAAGRIAFDEFESRREGYIGP